MTDSSTRTKNGNFNKTAVLRKISELRFQHPRYGVWGGVKMLTRDISKVLGRGVSRDTIAGALNGESLPKLDILMAMGFLLVGPDEIGRFFEVLCAVAFADAPDGA